MNYLHYYTHLCYFGWSILWYMLCVIFLMKFVNTLLLHSQFFLFFFKCFIINTKTENIRKSSVHSSLHGNKKRNMRVMSHSIQSRVKLLLLSSYMYDLCFWHHWWFRKPWVKLRKMVKTVMPLQKLLSLGKSFGWLKTGILYKEPFPLSDIFDMVKSRMS